MSEKNEPSMSEAERAAITGRTESGAEKDAQTQAATTDRVRQTAAKATSKAGAIARVMAGDSVQRYGVVRPVLHGKRHFRRGETLDLTPGQAKHLLETKAIGLISDEPVFLVDGEPIVSADRVLPRTDDVLLDRTVIV